MPQQIVRQVLQLLLAGDDPVLSIIRRQLDNAMQSPTELTGVGFFTHFEVSEQSPRIPGNPSFRFGDVIGGIEGLERGVGFLLFIDDGMVTMLEGYTYEEPWPHEVGRFELKNMDGTARNLSTLRATPGWPVELTNHGPSVDKHGQKPGYGDGGTASMSE